MKSAALPNSARTIALGLAIFACVAAVTVFLWWVQPLAAGALGFLVLFGSAPTILHSTGPRQAASIGVVTGFLIGSAVALLSSTFGAA